jgi:SAM-dependent methyltransferase
LLSLRKRRQRAEWDKAPWEGVAERIAPVHDHLVTALEARGGERWLDVATGTGAVAIRAAARGASVAGIDIAPRMIQRAREKAVESGLDIEFSVGDAERLAFPDATFDVVASAFGVEEPPDQAAVAGELVRVCRRDGRVGLAVWAKDPEWEVVRAPFQQSRVEAWVDGTRWADREFVCEVLGSRFDLRFEEGVILLDAKSGEAAWKAATGSGGMLADVVARLSDSRRNEFHAAYVDYYERFRNGDRVAVPRRYLLVLGHRR